MQIKVAIADDHQLVINGIQKMLSTVSCIDVTATYLDGPALLEGLEQQQPDVLLLDIQLPGKTGDKLATFISRHYPELRVLALTNFDSIFYVRTMLSHGALGYLLKSTDQQTLVEAITTVYDYREFVEPSLRTQLEQGNLKKNRTGTGLPALSAREKEVVQLIADGLTTQEIADKLFIGLTTAENYRYNLLSKLGVKNTAMLIKKAVQLGLVQ